MKSAFFSDSRINLTLHGFFSQQKLPLRADASLPESYDSPYFNTTSKIYTYLKIP